MKEIVIRKTMLHETQLREDLQDKSPEELIGMMWQLALNPWSFKETVDAEPRLQKHVVVLKRGRVDFMIVGAYALAAHGFRRATGDIDMPKDENWEY